MNLLQKFQAFIDSEQLPLKGSRLLLAVSGGIDSVALCHLCKESGFDVTIAHCNFQLRGAESAGDEVFVEKLATDLALPFFVKHFDTDVFARQNKMGIQEAARKLRYDWFAELMKPAVSEGFDFLLTAHHADDNIETLLMNFFKGTGINGLRAILPQKDGRIRPLLFAYKEEIIDYANDHKISFREDSSNISNKYTRNYFRNELIPAVEKVFPEVRQNLMNNISRFRDIAKLYEASVASANKKLLTKKGAEYHIPALLLAQMPALHTIVHEIIDEFGFTAHQVGDVIGLLNAGSGKYVCSSSHRILKNRKWLIISPLGLVSADHFPVEAGEKEILCGASLFKFSKFPVPEKIPANRKLALLDAAEIKFPLLIRRWKQSDYFYPLGMRKKKKLSRFFIDEKLSILQKENIWVVESAGRVIWVAGHRIDDRFKIKPETREVFQISV